MLRLYARAKGAHATSVRPLRRLPKLPRQTTEQVSRQTTEQVSHVHCPIHTLTDSLRGLVMLSHADVTLK